MRRTRSPCCARAASGHAVAAPPSATSKSRRPMVTVMRPSRARCVKGRIPRHERAVPNSAAPGGAGGTPGLRPQGIAAWGHAPPACFQELSAPASGPHHGMSHECQKRPSAIRSPRQLDHSPIRHGPLVPMVSFRVPAGPAISAPLRRVPAQRTRHWTMTAMLHPATKRNHRGGRRFPSPVLPRWFRECDRPTRQTEVRGPSA